LIEKSHILNEFFGNKLSELTKGDIKSKDDLDAMKALIEEFNTTFFDTVDAKVEEKLAAKKETEQVKETPVIEEANEDEENVEEVAIVEETAEAEETDEAEEVAPVEETVEAEETAPVEESTTEAEENIEKPALETQE
jgi:hypothetical protein